MSGAVIAAIDLGPFSARVLYHAAGFARLLSARLRVLHVSSAPTPAERERVIEFCRQGPYEINPDDMEVVVAAGSVSDAIYREADKSQAELVVIGSRGHNGVVKLLLGSTGEAVLRNAPAPVLLVPPTDIDIINISDRVRLNCGPIIAAVDLAETCVEQIAQASRLAQIAGQPLVLMTVAPQRLDDHQAAASLRERAHALEPVPARSVIIRRGKVGEQISRCAAAEGSGLVVMGLRSKGRGQPGAIASAVLGTKRTFVLAVPGC